MEGSDGPSSPRVLVFNGLDWNVEQSVTVTGMDDAIDDDDQVFSIMLVANSSDSNYAGRSKSVSATNLDNDSSSTAAFSEDSYTVLEGAGDAEITINRLGGIDGEFTATFMTDDTSEGTTATKGEDYESVEIELVFADQEASKTVTIPMLTDEIKEEPESVVLKLKFGDPAEPDTVTSVLVIKDPTIIDPEDPKTDSNEGEIAGTIVKTCVKGNSTDEFQALCDSLVGEALEGGYVFGALNQIAPEEAAGARAPAGDSMSVQNANVGGRMAALRGGATGFSFQGFSLNIAGFNMNGDMMRSAFTGFNTNSVFNANQPGFSTANANGSSDSMVDFGRWGCFYKWALNFLETRMHLPMSVGMTLIRSA